VSLGFTGSPSGSREKEIASVIALLPAINKELLSRLIQFLHNVISNFSVKKRRQSLRSSSLVLLEDSY